MFGKYKNTLIASLGSGIEYYDFIVYALMSPYLSRVFFHSANDTYNLINYFSVFALGYVFRPIGGVFLGYISDKYGRKQALVLAMLLMCISTLSIAFLPVNYISNVVAVTILILCRVLQGISFGGELSNAITFVYENNKNKYLHGSFIFTNAGIGNILAILTVNFLSYRIGYENIISFWWRLPFFFGGVLMLGCLFLRCHLQEKRVVQKSGFKFIGIISKIKKQMFEVVLAVLLSTSVASLIITNLFFPTFFSDFYSYKVSEIYNLMMYSMMFAVISSPISGILLNRDSNKVRIIIYSSAIFLSVLMCMLFNISNNNLFTVFLFMSVYQVFIGFFVVLFLPFMASMFSSDVRNTTVAFCYNVGYIIASFIPNIVIYFKTQCGKFFMFYVIGAIYLLLIMFLIFKERKSLDYDRSKNYS